MPLFARHSLARSKLRMTTERQSLSAHRAAEPHSSQRIQNLIDLRGRQVLVVVKTDLKHRGGTA
jgi:hypothetical protein